MNLQLLELAVQSEKVPYNDPKTPVRYTVNLDWFEALFSGDLVQFATPLERYDYDLKNITLLKKDMGTGLFKYRYDIFVKGKIFGAVNVCPRNTAILKANLIQFQMVNNVMYEVGWLKDVQYLMEKMGWKMHNLSRIDIAIDGVRPGFLELYNRWQNGGDLERIGKTQTNVFQLPKHNKVTGYDVGKKSSGKWITCYNKSEEIERSNKYYIRTMWEKAGMDTKGVERMELKLRNDSIKAIKDFDWTRLDDFEYLAGVFKASCHRFFEFVEKKNSLAQKNISRVKRYQYIDWDELGAASLERLSTKQTNELYRMKLTCKTMFGIYCSTGIKLYSQLAQEIAANINCTQWYIDKCEEWRAFFEKKLGNNKDGLIHFEWIHKYRQYAMNEQVCLFEFERAPYVPKY